GGVASGDASASGPGPARSSNVLVTRLWRWSKECSGDVGGPLAGAPPVRVRSVPPAEAGVRAEVIGGGNHAVAEHAAVGRDTGLRRPEDAIDVLERRADVGLELAGITGPLLRRRRRVEGVLGRAGVGIDERVVEDGVDRRTAHLVTGHPGTAAPPRRLAPDTD